MKRLQKSEFILTYMIIITLACFIGGFFLGASYMKSKIDAQTAAAAEEEKEKAEKERMLKERKLYKDQDFVRFYYSVYTNVAEVKEKHFQMLAELASKTGRDQKTLLKEMQEFAEDKESELDKQIPLGTSPLLLQAKTAYQHALQSYSNSLDKVAANVDGSTLVDRLNDETALASQSWLLGDSYMYHAVATWDSLYGSKKPIPLNAPVNATPAQWQSYPFHYRAYLAANYLARLKIFGAHTPLDWASRIDALIQSEQIKSLGVNEIPAVVRVLQVTDAVRTGDFQNMRAKSYRDLKAPEMPLYTE